MDESTISFRVRVDNINGGSSEEDFQFKNFVFAGIDADCNGSIDFFLGMYNPTGNNGRLGIYSSDQSSSNNGPSTTGISGKPLLAFEPQNGINYSIKEVTDGSDFYGDSDYFLLFSFSIEDISKALQGTAFEGFDQQTPFRFIVGTASQDNSFNQDINGMDKSGYSSGMTWSSLGVYSDVVTADGSVNYKIVTFDENTKADGTGDIVSVSTVIKDDVNVYAQWSKTDKYLVTFDYNYTGSPDSGIYATAETINGVLGINMPDTDPVKTGSEFAGWCTTADGKDIMIDASTNIASLSTDGSKELRVYAIWSTSKKTPVLFYNDTTLIATVYPNGASTYAPILPDNTGIEFGGWSLVNGSSTVSIGDGNKIPNSATGPYYAIWKTVVIPEYTITFNGNLSYEVTGVPENKIVSNGKFGTLPDEPSLNGYKFIEWNLESDGSGEAIYSTTDIDSDIMVYAIWQQEKAVTFYANNGSGDYEAINSTQGKLYTFPQPPTRDGYTFLGWGTTSDATVTVNIMDITDYTELYGVWSPIHNVTFKLSGGTWNGTDSSDKIIGTAYNNVLYVPVVSEKTGYVFSGWKITGNDEINSEMIIPMGSTGDLSYTAVFVPADNTNYKVETYIMDKDGNYPESPYKSYFYTGTTGTKLLISSIVDNTVLISGGIQFDYGKINGEVVTDGIISSDGSLVIKMYYKRLKHTVTLEKNDGILSVSGSGDYYYGEDVVINASIKAGYNWSEWSSLNDQSGDLDSIVSGFTMPAGDVILKATGNKIVLDEGHGIEGTIVDDDTPASIVPYATIIIKKGTEEFGRTVTDGNGDFAIYNIPSGLYNLIMIIGDKTEIVSINVRSDIPVTKLGVIIFPLGNASSLLKLFGEKTPQIVIGNLHPEAEDYFGENGKVGFVKVEMKIERTDEDKAISEGDKSLISAISRIKGLAAKTKGEILIYLDMEIDKYQRETETDDWDFTGKIIKTNGLIEITIPIPSEIQGKNSYVILRDHEGVVTEINETPNEFGEYLVFDKENWILTLYVNNFSLYAIASVDESTVTLPIEETVVSNDLINEQLLNNDIGQDIPDTGENNVIYIYFIIVVVSSVFVFSLKKISI